jgi:hypothetical protein
VFSLTTWLLASPEKPSIAIATAVQFKTFYRTCSAMRVLLMAGLVGLSTSDRILTSYAIDYGMYQKCQRKGRGKQHSTVTAHSKGRNAVAK